MLLYDLREKDAPCTLGRAFWIGLLAAAVTLFEYPGLPCSIVLTVYAVIVLRPRGSARTLAAFAAGGLLPALLMMHFQAHAFGSPFTPGHLMVENAAFRAAHHQGLYGAVGPSFAALYGLLLDLGAGLFPLTPVLWLAFPGFYLLLKKREHRAEAWCALAISVLTLLAISSMNNWRGGWTIGPRYLALAVPFLAWAALHALERLAQRAELHACALAIGTMLTGLLASGLPSAYYPHLPPELTRPLSQLFAVLIAHGYAPPNAGAWLGLHGSVSMLPLLAAALCTLWFCTRSIEGTRARTLLALFSGLIALGFSAPLVQRPSEEPGVDAAVAFITRHWMPAGHDDAARLTHALQSQGPLREQQLVRLAELYAKEGRIHEAERARRGKLSL
jgi:hypothetical protein